MHLLQILLTDSTTYLAARKKKKQYVAFEIPYRTYNSVLSYGEDNVEPKPS